MLRDRLRRAWAWLLVLVGLDDGAAARPGSTCRVPESFDGPPLLPTLQAPPLAVALPDPSAPRCQTCPFWQLKPDFAAPWGIDRFEGECRRRAPPWPQARAYDWCSLHPEFSAQKREEGAR